MLNVENVDLFYGASQALKSVNLTAVAGGVTCVMGRNGVGKTSLMRRLVAQAHGLRLAAIVNDLANLNMDAALVSEAGTTISSSLVSSSRCCESSSIGGGPGDSSTPVRTSPVGWPASAQPCGRLGPSGSSST